MIASNTRNLEMYVGGAELFTIDLAERLGGDTLSGAATWTLSSSHVTKSDETNDATTVTVRLSASVAGVYTAAVSVGTAGGDTLVDYITLTVLAIGS